MPSLKSSQEFDYSFIVKMCFQKFGETRKHCNFVNHTYALDSTLMADSVKWLSQSDYSICISILVEFYYM